MPLIEMCNMFEDRLAKFLKSLSDNNVKTTTPEHGRDEVDQQPQKPKRRRMQRRKTNLRTLAGNEKQQPTVG